MEENKQTNEPSSVKCHAGSRPASGETSVVDAVFDAALAWVDVGLNHLKSSLDGSARAMERTAKAVEVVRERLRS